MAGAEAADAARVSPPRWCARTTKINLRRPLGGFWLQGPHYSLQLLLTTSFFPTRVFCLDELPNWPLRLKQLSGFCKRRGKLATTPLAGRCAGARRPRQERWRALSCMRDWALLTTRTLGISIAQSVPSHRTTLYDGAVFAAVTHWCVFST